MNPRLHLLNHESPQKCFCSFKTILSLQHFPFSPTFFIPKRELENNAYNDNGVYLLHALNLEKLLMLLFFCVCRIKNRIRGENVEMEAEVKILLEISDGWS